MNYTIDQNAGISAYMQLYNQLVRDITTGIYPFGKKLPSKRTIAAEVGLSVITVEHALALLSDEGYVEARERSGYFVIYRESEFFSERKEPDARKAQEPLRIIRHQESVDSEFPYGVTAKTIRRVLMDYGEQILVKSPNHGCGELRQEICSYLARSRGKVSLLTTS